MANYERIATRKARKYGLNPRIFRRQIRQESGFQPHVVSPAGARGIAQIMPATARSWGVNPDNPRQALDAAARHMAQDVRRYGSYENALRAYNAGPGAIQASHGYAETNAYVRNILGGSSPRATGRERGGGGGGGAGRRTGGDAGTVRLGRPDLFNFSRQTTFDKAGYEQAERRSMVARMLQRSGRGNSSLFHTGLLSTATPDPADFTGSKLISSITRGSNSRLIPGRPGTVIGGSGGAGVLTAKGRGRVAIAANADRPGVPTNRRVIRFVRQVSALSGEALTISTGSRHSRMTSSGNVSDHWGGNAADIPASGRNLIRVGRAALIAAGMSPAQARKAKGGIYNVRGGQIIFNAPDHYDHVHVNPPDHLRRVRARKAGRRAEKRLTGR
jgi:hypothetical protein